MMRPARPPVASMASWGDFNPEAQAGIVNEWFGGDEKDPWAKPPARVPTNNLDPTASSFGAADPYFHQAPNTALRLSWPGAVG